MDYRRFRISNPSRQIIPIPYYGYVQSRNNFIQYLNESKLNQTIDVLTKAFDKYDSLEKLIFHSEQGWQYQMQQYQKYLKEKGVIQSMSRKGNCLGNSPMENFFGKMKNEMFYGFECSFESLDDLKIAMDEYIEYYNTKRITVKLKGLPPVQYRNKSLITA